MSVFRPPSLPASSHSSSLPYLHFHLICPTLHTHTHTCAYFIFICVPCHRRHLQLHAQFLAPTAIAISGFCCRSLIIIFDMPLVICLYCHGDVDKPKGRRVEGCAILPACSGSVLMRHLSWQTHTHTQVNSCSIRIENMRCDYI